MLAIGRGVLAPTAFHVARANHGSRNRSIAISKLIMKFQEEGDPITYVECFEQVYAAFRDISDGDKIGAFGIQLDGHVHGIEHLKLKRKIHGIP